MSPRSRRIVKTVTTKTGVTLETCYCRKCMKIKPEKDFYDSFDTFLDSNGKLSICRDCVQNIYDRIYSYENNMERTILRVCRLLNMRYDENAIEVTKKFLQTSTDNGRNIEGVFGVYKARLMSVQRTRMTDRDLSEDMTFVEPTSGIIAELTEKAIDDREYLESKWGKGMDFNSEDYEYLETEYKNWSSRTEIDGYDMEILVREICHKQNAIRKARILGNNAQTLVKELQELMKNSGLTPSSKSAASGGKSAEVYGVWLADIEEKTPAEWFAEQTKYRDMDGIQADIDDIKRSIGSFMTGSRDFNISELEDLNDINIEDTSEENGG